MAKKSVTAKSPQQADSKEQTDPIIVGGGGSVLIMIRKDTSPQIVDSNNPNYFCIKCDVNITKIVANDGFGTANSSVSPPGDMTGQVHPTRHRTNFKNT